MTNDPAFDAGVDHPAYPPGEGPSILLDGAHHNFFVDEGFMVPFQRLMRADGYRITVGRSAWSSEYLSEFDIVVVITALPFDYGEKSEVTDEVTFSATRYGPFTTG
jgi:hypothetical protein